MSRTSLEAAIPPGAALVLDTSVVLAYLDGDELVSPAAVLVIDEFVRGGRNLAFLSAVTVTETLVRPIAAGEAAVAIGEGFLRHFPNLAIVPVDYDVAREAARIRAETKLRTPDALVIATASTMGQALVVANDAQWERAISTATPGVQLCHLDAHAPM